MTTSDELEPPVPVVQHAAFSKTKIMHDLLELSTTNVSLSTLRLIRGTMSERNFHEATYILYDIRTLLGDRPVKYLEIGSFTGTSSSLMLKHPFKTHVTGVDPCVLDESFFRGTLSQEQTIRKNLMASEKKGCAHTSPWRLRVGYSPHALPLNESFDIIFIDGDHSTTGVWTDYKNTLPLLRPGGYMVFDDYVDPYSPHVRPAVDSIAQTTDLVPIGTPPNIHGIHLEANQSVINEYIFAKPGTFQPKPQQPHAMPVLCVVTPTYLRKDRSSKRILESLWHMLQGQSYQNWRLYLTGDNYKDENEWHDLSFFNHPRASIYNMKNPGERGKLSGTELWPHAGGAALNEGIQRALSDGYSWMVHLDDDDHWDPDHLEHIHAGIRTGATFVQTSCQFHETYLPAEAQRWGTHLRHDVPPRPCGTVLSSIAFDAIALPIQYEMHPETPDDAYMWARIVFEDKFFPVFVPSLSCHHVPYTVRKVRFTLIQNITVPVGWYSIDDENVVEHYITLATWQFPSSISEHCLFVVGPSQGNTNFVELEKHQVPYHIRIVEEFNNLHVWKAR
jgi:hypothetical protein